ncbi:hypothetical protein [Streptomyces sp. NPDC046976]|uniref:hypothetical protein n=1 Tax=Streptomyces sp. NPDC046976 TaxID=3155258 RepID=UPI0033C498D3
MFNSSWRPLRRIAPLALPLLFVTSCGSQGVEKTAKVSVDRVVGTWKAGDGEQLSFAADHTFASGGLDSKKLAADHCPGAKATGNWAFFAEQDGLYGTSDSAVSGSEIGLAFDGLPQGRCTITLAFVDGGRTLCATDDADDPCALDVRFTRRT